MSDEEDPTIAALTARAGTSDQDAADQTLMAIKARANNPVPTEPKFGVLEGLASAHETDVQEGQSLAEGTAGGAEAVMHAASGQLVGAAGALTRHKYPDAERALTYQPHSEVGKLLVAGGEKVQSTLHAPGNALIEGAGTGPTASPMREVGGAINTATDLALARVGSRVSGEPVAGAEPAVEAAAAPSVSDKILSDSRRAGYVVPPATSNPGIINRGIEGFAGKASVAQAASIKNQVVTDNLARKALKLPPDAELTPKTMAESRGPANDVYEQVKSAGPITVDPQYHADLDRLTSTSGRIQKDLPNFSTGAQAQIKELTDSLRPENGKLDSETAVEVSKGLRYEANSNFSASARMGDPKLKALGQAQQKAAAAVEDQVERHLISSGQPDLAGQWDDARIHIAKTYSVQNALDGAGHVDAQKLGKQLIKGKPLSDELETAANFANAFPKAARVLPGKESMPGMSPLDVYGSVATSFASGSPLPLLLGPGRMAARKLALSKALQSKPVSYGSLLNQPPE